MIQEEIRVFNDWSGGHWGRLGPFKAAENMYRSVNLQRYANGTLGPRPGWKLLETTGSAPAPSAGSGSEFYGMLWVPGASGGGNLVFVSKADSTATKKLPMDTLVWASLSSIGAPTEDMQLTVPGGGNIHTHHADHIVVGGHKWTNVNTNVGASITFPGSFSPKASIPYKNRMYYWGDATNKGRIFYSEAGLYAIVNSNAFFDVGFDRSVVGCWDIKDSLLILTLAGNIAGRQLHAEWWTLQGANPVTGSLRRLSKGEWPYVAAYAVEFKDALLWLDVLYDHGVYIQTGTDLDTVSLARLSGRGTSDSSGGTSQLMKPTATVGEPSIVLPYRVGADGSWDDETATVIGDYYENGLQAWELVNGAWVKASYWNGATEEIVTNGVPFLWAVTDWGGNRLIGCTNTSEDGSGEFKFYTRDITLNRPSMTNDNYSDADEAHTDIASSGDGLDCRLWLPPIQADEGSGVKITKVVVDFDYWQNDTYFPAGAALKMKVLNYRQSRGWSGESEELVADLSVFEDSTQRQPSRGRLVFHLPDSAWFSAAQVYFTEVRNLAFDKVSVHFERNPRDPE